MANSVVCCLSLVAVFLTQIASQQAEAQSQGGDLRELVHGRYALWLTGVADVVCFANPATVASLQRNKVAFQNRTVHVLPVGVPRLRRGHAQE